MFSAFLLFSISAGSQGDLAAVLIQSSGATSVVLVRSDSGETTVVSECEGLCEEPVWSPDGERLAWVDRSGDSSSIVVARADGSDHRVVSESFAVNAEPAWAEDGERLAYAGGEVEPSHIVVCNVRNGREIAWGQSVVPLRDPAWLPDPRMVGVLAEQTAGEVSASLQMDLQWGGILATGIHGSLPVEGESEETAVSSTDLRDVTTEIYVVTLRSAFAVPAAALPSSGDYEEWQASPDVRGQRVAFESNDGGDREIYTATPNGAFGLSNHRAADWNPVWAPRGQSLMFESFRGGTRGIYRTHRETARVETIALSESGDFWGADWSADARSVVCVGNPDGRPQLYVANVGSGDVVRISTDDSVSFADPAWRPQP